MLNDASSIHAPRLQFILEQARNEQRVTSRLRTSWREDSAAFYTACYALIRVGNAIALHSRQLEQMYPNYPWVY